MPKEDFQGLGKQHQASGVARYPEQINECNSQLTNRSAHNLNPKSDLNKAEEWKHLERTAEDGKTKLNQDGTPWHGLAAVKESAAKKYAG